jgi:hypothetical protein
MAEDADFEEEIIKKVIFDTLENDCIPDKNVNVNNFKELARTIVDDLYKELHKLKKMFKYSVTVLLQQKVGAALNYGSAMYVDNTADGQVTHFYNDSKYYDLVISIAGYKITQKS